MSPLADIEGKGQAKERERCKYELEEKKEKWGPAHKWSGFESELARMELSFLSSKLKLAALNFNILIYFSQI